VAIANRNKLNLDLSFEESLIATHSNRYNLLMDFVEENKTPILFFSYEKAITDKNLFVESVARFVGINDSSKIENATKLITPNDKEYINNSNKLIADLRWVKQGEVFGLAKIKYSNKQLRLKFLINNVHYKDIIANQVNKRNKDKPPHFFNESIKNSNLKVGETYKISVLDHNGKHIKNSPYIYIHQ